LIGLQNVFHFAIYPISTLKTTFVPTRIAIC